MEMSLPYLAGFFDGEGSIGIYRNGRAQCGGRTLRVQITQTISPESTALLEQCRDRWGGSLGPFNRTLRRPAWNYQATASKGVAMLRDLRPHLVLKAAQADVALTWWDQRPEVRLRGPNGRMLPFPVDVAALDQAAERQLKAMKHDVVDAADLVSVDHTLRQFLNVKGD